MEQEAGPGDISSFTLQRKEKSNSWTWLLSLPRIMMHTMWLCLPVYGCTHWEVVQHQEKGPISATVAEFWSRTMSFVCLEASGVSWARCCISMASPAWRPEESYIFFVFQEISCPGNSHFGHIPGGLPIQEGIKWKTWPQKNRMLKTLYWQHFTSLVQTSSLVWCCPLLLMPAGGTMPEFDWLIPFFFWACWACSMVLSTFLSVSHWEWLDCVVIISTHSGS